MTTLTPNHIEFTDNQGNRIHLTRASEFPVSLVQKTSQQHIMQDSHGDSWALYSKDTIHRISYMDTRTALRRIGITDNTTFFKHRLPGFSDDNYMHYLIGYHDGAVQEDSDYDQHYDETCPPEHTQEYCAAS